MRRGIVDLVADRLIELANRVNDTKGRRKHNVRDKEHPLFGVFPARDTHYLTKIVGGTLALFPDRIRKALETSLGNVNDTNDGKKRSDDSPDKGEDPLAIQDHDNHGDPDQRNEQGTTLPGQDPDPALKPRREGRVEGSESREALQGRATSDVDDPVVDGWEEADDVGRVVTRGHEIEGFFVDLEADKEDDRSNGGTVDNRLQESQNSEPREDAVE